MKRQENQKKLISHRAEYETECAEVSIMPIREILERIFESFVFDNGCKRAQRCFRQNQTFEIPQPV